MDPTAFSELAWLLVVQSNAIPSQTQLGNTCREWHVRRLELGLVIENETASGLDQAVEQSPISSIQALLTPQTGFGGCS